MGSPRVAVVFRFWQGDKENHGWREGPPATVLSQSFRSAGRAFTLRLNQFRTKTRILLYVVDRKPPQNIGRFKTTIRLRKISRYAPHSLRSMGRRISCAADRRTQVRRRQLSYTGMPAISRPSSRSRGPTAICSAVPFKFVSKALPTSNSGRGSGSPAQAGGSGGTEYR